MNERIRIMWMENKKRIEDLKAIKNANKNNCWYDIFIQNPTFTVFALCFVGAAGFCFYRLNKQCLELQEENVGLKRELVVKKEDANVQFKSELLENTEKVNNNLLYLMGGGYVYMFLKKLK
jgi:hypothetical protein